MIGTILGGAAGIMAAPTVGGLAYRKARQRRGAKALEITTPNRIVEQQFIKVGGIEQWIQLPGEDRANPVLLVLHGGPGWPNAVFTLPLRPWEQHFTVIQWDHRGAGKTLAASRPRRILLGRSSMRSLRPACWYLPSSGGFPKEGSCLPAHLSRSTGCSRRHSTPATWMASWSCTSPTRP